MRLAKRTDERIAYPRTVIPHSIAFSATAFARSMPCCTVQLILALLNPSVALTNTATSLTPCSIAISSPLRFGTRTGSRRPDCPCSCLMDSFPSTSRQSANCGIAFGETTDVNSIVRRPVARSRWINSSFTDVGTGSLIFCRPSRGPTSTMRTALVIVIVPVYLGATLRSETEYSRCSVQIHISHKYASKFLYEIGRDGPDYFYSRSVPSSSYF